MMRITTIVLLILTFSACAGRKTAVLPESKTNAEKPLSTTLISPLANAETRALFAFLHQNFGKKVLSGQQDLTWQDSVDQAGRVFKRTGKYPAVMGYDFMNYHRKSIDGGSGLRQTEEAIAWHNRGGIVTFCWHWRDPSQKTVAFYTKDTDFRINLNDSTIKKQLLNDIDSVAVELRKLEKAGVPVLWRPLHEASGAWFWWGASGPQPAIDLWKLMVVRLRDYHKLTNLIWVHNGQHPDWYPGDEWVDIVGEDVYAKVDSISGPDYSSQKARFLRAQLPTKSKKIIALTENGIIPSVEAMQKDGIYWSWFCTWNDGPDFANPKNFFSGTYWNSHAHKKAVFNSELVLTLDELPRNIESGRPYKK